LVKDINPIPEPADSAPEILATVGGVGYFVADDGDTGRELWRTDGTVAGTFRLTDACPEECSANPVAFGLTDRSIFFLAIGDSDALGRDLWVSSGTPATTFKLTEARVLFPSASGLRRRWVASQGLHYFAASDGVHGVELWRSDGTPAGTHMVTDLWPGPQHSSPRELTEFKGLLYFTADDPQRGPLLWKSDGTPQGTRAVRDPLPAAASHSGPEKLRVAGGHGARQGSRAGIHELQSSRPLFIQWEVVLHSRRRGRAQGALG
jgi:ELWxxDGT repeat protein